MAEPRAITVVLAEDHAIAREGLAAVLSAEADISVVGQASDGSQALEMIRALRPDVAMVDLNMPKLHGIEVIRRTRKWNSQVRMGVLSINHDQKIVTEALRVGANAYLLKDGPGRHLVEAIHIMMAGGIYISPRLQPQALLDADGPGPTAAGQLETLSSGEYELLSFLVEGVRAKEIAARLDISPETVSKIKRKLRISCMPGKIPPSGRGGDSGTPLAAYVRPLLEDCPTRTRKPLIKRDLKRRVR